MSESKPTTKAKATFCKGDRVVVPNDGPYDSVSSGWFSGNIGWIYVPDWTPDLSGTVVQSTNGILMLFMDNGYFVNLPENAAAAATSDQAAASEHNRPEWWAEEFAKYQ